MIEETLLEATDKMDKAVEVAKDDFATVRTGRANASLFSKVVVMYYGAPTPLQQLASFQNPEARTLLITPFDRGALNDIERALRDSDLGANPSNDGNVIRLQIPDLTEERRREMVKVVHGVGEGGKISIRNVRRDVMHDLREMKKDGEIGEDDERRAESELQRLTDEATHHIDAALKSKEAEILEV